jgi:hypothetical protein
MDIMKLFTHKELSKLKIKLSSKEEFPGELVQHCFLILDMELLWSHWEDLKRLNQQRNIHQLMPKITHLIS